jgi:hypothetical protein
MSRTCFSEEPSFPDIRGEQYYDMMYALSCGSESEKGLLYVPAQDTKARRKQRNSTQREMSLKSF